MCAIDWTALGTWVLAIVTSLTLWKVWGYAGDTRKIVALTEGQSEAAIAPFLAIIQDSADISDKGYYFMNKGRGPALNIRYRAASEGTAEMQHIYSAMAPDDSRKICALHAPWHEIDGFLLTYESLSGARYQTEFYFSNDETGSMLTSYQRLS
jgi:hypothetical protein